MGGKFGGKNKQPKHKKTDNNSSIVTCYFLQILIAFLNLPDKNIL
jgi:hypothetical protein